MNKLKDIEQPGQRYTVEQITYGTPDFLKDQMVNDLKLMFVEGSAFSKLLNASRMKLVRDLGETLAGLISLPVTHLSFHLACKSN